MDKRVGRNPPGYTINRDGERILDEQIVSLLKTYRSSIEFVNGGGTQIERVTGNPLRESS